ncbi:hypothetical protein [Frigoribacterium faeni]|uniref:hypothetical protein n=1 Tax=Frigoribacterium faeni TaxID=145483 RepID=UPI0035AEBFC2
MAPAAIRAIRSRSSRLGPRRGDAAASVGRLSSATRAAISDQSGDPEPPPPAVSYTHLRAHETAKKKKT